MSDDHGQKLTNFELTININWKENTIAVIPNQEVTIATLLDVLEAAYRAVVHTGQQMLDKPSTHTLQ